MSESNPAYSKAQHELEARLLAINYALVNALKPMLAYIKNAPVSPRSNYEEYAALRDAAEAALRLAKS